ncbi:putative LRR receptor-like serine/threonine-protein kinase EFR-like [Capsicum annuum]|nr:putative LRR receptor-like serine/threonine-protein kinase EFR-like [Capsicum annuum]
MALTGKIPRDLGNLSFLVSLDLGSNNFHGNLPQEMTRLLRLKFLDLSFNNIRGEIPSWFGFLHRLQVLYIRNNSFTGSMPSSFSNMSTLETLNLKFNSIEGQIPKVIGSLVNLRVLNLRGNIPEGIDNLHNMNWLSIQANQLTGSIPLSVFNISRIETIAFTMNSLSGNLPNGLCNGLPILKGLNLSINNLHGRMPTSLSNCSKRQILSLSDNEFDGPIHSEIGRLSNLQHLYLGYNPFTDSVVHLIHLGSNKLSSNIPPSLGNLQDQVVLDLSSNNMVDSLPLEIGNLKAVIKMDLPMNQFSNEIPREIGELQNLAHLSLRHNKLQVSIPDSMSNMIGSEFLDLFHNNISGIIPKSLEKHQNLKYFNISVNKLHGEIPSGGPFKNLSSQFFIYNEALCGSSRFSVPPCPTSSKHRSNRKKLLVLFLLLGIVPSTIIFFWIRYRKGVLRSGTAIAVKVFNLQLDAAFKSFDTECEVLCRLRHRNLVKVITSCSNLDFKALLLEYMPNGSLEKYLYSYNYFLDTKQRLSKMIDVACALEYLHHGCSLPLGEDQGDLYTKTLATLGYIAPEYGLEGRVSTKCDVYSYGVMLLETFTRRKPNEFEGDLSLKQWVSYSLPEAIMDVVDANLVTATANQKELDVVASIMKVALDCCAEYPGRRTNMKDVVGMLQKIKIQLLAY